MSAAELYNRFVVMVSAALENTLIKIPWDYYIVFIDNMILRLMAAGGHRG